VSDLITEARTALIEDRRQLSLDELASLAGVPGDQVPALAALAHEVRLAWCGPTVEIEGILSAKTGGCPEDCHFCSQSSAFPTEVQATPFLDTGEVLAAARETADRGGTGRSTAGRRAAGRACGSATASLVSGSRS
jgi:biotin synthase